jgi:hypothetical protein
VQEPVSGYIKKIEDLIQERDDARSSRDFYKCRADALQQWQSEMRDPERTIVCDILANGCTLEPAGDRYTTPPAQPAVPLTDEPKKLFGYEIWNRFYRSKEELLQEMVRSNSGYPQDWIEANIRDVYVHGIPAIEAHHGITKGQP